MARMNVGEKGFIGERLIKHGLNVLTLDARDILFVKKGATLEVTYNKLKYYCHIYESGDRGEKKLLFSFYYVCRITDADKRKGYKL
jgi:Zn/Cd-binding protein ZinT